MATDPPPSGFLLKGALWPPICSPHPADVSRVFIFPALPRLRAAPPIGENWLFEVKLDGYRIQLHKSGLAVTIYRKNGADFTRRYPVIAAAVLGLHPHHRMVQDSDRRDKLSSIGTHGQRRR